MTLEYLKISYIFNKPIDLTYLINLKKLILGNIFNQSIDNKLPEGLLYLELGENFNQPLDNLPNTLISLKVLSKKYTHNLDILFPDSIKELILPKTIK